MPQFTPEQKRKMLAAAELVDGGDMAVLKKLIEFMDFVEDYTQKFEELSQAMEKMMSEHQSTMSEEMADHIKEMKTEMMSIKEGVDKKIEELNQKTDKSELVKELNSLKTQIASFPAKLEEIRDLIPVLPPEVDLTDIYNQLLELEKKIPTIPEELKPEQIRDKLESLQDDQRLSISAIHKLEEILDELRQRPIGRGGGGFSKIAMDGHIIDDETPSGTVDGANTVFTLANRPNPSSSLKVYVNGQRMRITTDYTFSVSTVTFVTAPPTDSILLVDYRI